MRSEVEQLLIEDSIEKKKTGRGIYGRASRLGFIKGGVKTQYDFMGRKEKKLLNGDVKVYNLYEKIENLPTYEQMKTMDVDKARQIIEYVKKNNSQRAIAKAWGITQSTVSLFYKRVGVSQKDKKNIQEEKPTKLKFKGIEKFPTREKFFSLKKKNQLKTLDIGYTQFSDTEIANHWGMKEDVLHKTLLFHELPIRKEFNTSKQTEQTEQTEQIKKSNNFNCAIDCDSICGEELNERLISISSIGLKSRKYKVSILIEEL